MLTLAVVVRNLAMAARGAQAVATVLIVSSGLWAWVRNKRSDVAERQHRSTRTHKE